MGHELQYLLETKRFVWLVAVVFVLFMMFQYFEFPNSHVVSSLFSAREGQIFMNTTHFHTSNTSNISNLHNNVSQASSSMSPTILPPISPSLPPTTAVNTINSPTIHSSPNTSVKDFKELQKNPVHSDNKSSAKEGVGTGNVVTLSKMHDMLVHNRASSFSMVCNLFLKSSLLVK